MENLKKKAKCWLVPTDNKSNIILSGFNTLFLTPPMLLKSSDIYVNLYITSDEEIKEGEWYLDSFNNSIIKANVNSAHRYYVTSCHKIIISTNKTLNLPQPSQGFINAYIEAYNNGHQIVDVMVEYETKTLMKPHDVYRETVTYIKTDSNNCATITKTKDSWSRDEVIDLCRKAHLHGEQGVLKLHNEIFKNWIEQNL